VSIIEKAVERLDQLKRAGAEVNVGLGEQSVATLDVFRERPAVTPRQEPHIAEVAPVPPKVFDDDAASQRKRVEIDLERMHALGMVTSLSSRSNIAEEYRVIKRPLLKNVSAGTTSGAHRNLIMVTSSVPGEGKSFSAINLAMSIAMELDHTVLLVDADVARPSILNILGLPPAKGLMDVLLSDGDVDLPDVMMRTNVEKLSILPAGTPHPRATEFLASDAMNQLLADIATRYSDRIVVFDSPPLLVTTEARVLATHMGQIVMVVESGRTTQGMVKQALTTIEACPLKLMLLNKTREQGASGYYGYHYGPYGYGSKN
jgi:protein-tyrosine kinase